jgi:RimJ/RimL family protein N-acetyltransferase
MVGARVSFRPYRAQDAPALLAWARTPDELLQWAGTIFTFPLDEHQLASYAAGIDRHRYLISAVGSSDSEVLAHAELKIEPELRLGKIGRVAVAPHARAAGIATDMLRWLTALAFDERGLERLELRVFSFNAPAIACYERVGFLTERIVRNARKSSDGYWDVIHMALHEHVYRSLHWPARSSR